MHAEACSWCLLPTSSCWRACASASSLARRIASSLALSRSLASSSDLSCAAHGEEGSGGGEVRQAGGRGAAGQRCNPGLAAGARELRGCVQRRGVRGGAPAHGAPAHAHRPAAGCAPPRARRRPRPPPPPPAPPRAPCCSSCRWSAARLCRPASAPAAASAWRSPPAGWQPRRLPLSSKTSAGRPRRWHSARQLPANQASATQRQEPGAPPRCT
jgi:hypothetical protein